MQLLDVSVSNGGLKKIPDESKGIKETNCTLTLW